MNATSSMLALRINRGLLFVLLSVFCATSLCAKDARVDAPKFKSSEDAVREVFMLIDARLALMRDVAASKFKNHQPIVDEPREQAVLDAVAQNAKALDLDERAVRKIFDSQIRMARSIQGYWFERWQRDVDQAAGAMTLGEIRPRLDTIGHEMLRALYLDRGELRDSALVESTAADVLASRLHEGVEPSQLRELSAALGDVRVTKALSVHTIQTMGELRIATTGDYAPFSYERDGKLFGLDIELAQSLAKSLGVRARFVRTSWPTLLGDYRAQRFDLAASGISVTESRAAEADFSAAYHVDGKIPIARCKDIRRYKTLAQIDQPNVRVIVNPGGTNEAFVRENIKRAKIVMHADNRTIFDELVAERADVMITDGVEADLQTLRHKELCRSGSRTFTRSAKAIMLPQGSDLRGRVDQWLQPQLASGDMRKHLQRALLEAR